MEARLAPHDVAALPLAYQSGTYEMDLKPATGEPGRDRGKYLFILRKMPIGWKYEYTMWNSDLPPK